MTYKDAFDESCWGEVWKRWADPAGGFILCVHVSGHQVLDEFINIHNIFYSIECIYSCISY